MHLRKLHFAHTISDQTREDRKSRKAHAKDSADIVRKGDIGRVHQAFASHSVRGLSGTESILPKT